MTQQDIKSEIKEWVEQRGREHVLSKLVARGIAPSTAQQLVAGSYKRSPRPMMTGIIRDEIDKDTRSAS